MARPKKVDNPLKMRGIITPSAWDAQNKITAITLSTVDEQEYRIHQNNKGKELFRLLRKAVEVSGVVGIDGHGNKTITVVAYEVKQHL